MGWVVLHALAGRGPLPGLVGRRGGRVKRPGSGRGHGHQAELTEKRHLVAVDVVLQDQPIPDHEDVGDLELQAAVAAFYKLKPAELVSSSLEALSGRWYLTGWTRERAGVRSGEDTLGHDRGIATGRSCPPTWSPSTPGATLTDLDAFLAHGAVFATVFVTALPNARADLITAVESGDRGRLSNGVPGSCERRKEHVDATKDLPNAAIERQLSRRDVSLREKTLWRMLYETAARASEILALDVEQLDFEQPPRTNLLQTRRDRMGPLGNRHRAPAPPAPAPPRRPGPLKRTAVSRQPQARACAAPACTRHLPAHRPRETRLRPRPNPPQGPHRMAAAPATPLRSDAPRTPESPAPADHGIMAKTRHKSPRTAMRYVHPSPTAVAQVTELLDPP